MLGNVVLSALVDYSVGLSWTTLPKILLAQQQTGLFLGTVVFAMATTCAPTCPSELQCSFSSFLGMCSSEGINAAALCNVDVCRLIIMRCWNRLHA